MIRYPAGFPIRHGGGRHPSFRNPTPGGNWLQMMFQDLTKGPLGENQLQNLQAGSNPGGMGGHFANADLSQQQLKLIGSLAGGGMMGGEGGMNFNAFRSLINSLGAPKPRHPMDMGRPQLQPLGGGQMPGHGHGGAPYTLPGHGHGGPYANGGRPVLPIRGQQFHPMSPGGRPHLRKMLIERAMQR